MSNRTYLGLTSLLIAAGGLIAIVTFAFAQGAADWINFGLATVALVASSATIAYRRSAGYRALSGAVWLIAAFTILVALGIFSGSAQYWVDFAGGVAIFLAGATARDTRVAELLRAESPRPVADAVAEPLRAAA